MVNKNEKEVLNRYEAEGWKVLRGGAPDFLMLKVNDGEIEDALFVEVKSPSDKLSYEQAIYRKILERLGATYKIELINPVQPSPGQSRPTHATPYQTKPGHATPSHSTPARSKPDHTSPDQTGPVQAIPTHARPAQPSTAHTNPDHSKPAQPNPCHTNPFQEVNTNGTES